jgi:hypothetical protein
VTMEKPVKQPNEYVGARRWRRGPLRSHRSSGVCIARASQAYGAWRSEAARLTPDTRHSHP